MEVSTLSSQVIRSQRSKLYQEHYIRAFAFSKLFYPHPDISSCDNTSFLKLGRIRAYPVLDKTPFELLSYVLYPGNYWSNRATYKKDVTPIAKSRIKAVSRRCFHEA